MDSDGWQGIEAVRVDVRNVLSAQEAFRHFTGAYAISLEALTTRQPMTFHCDHVEIHGDESGYMVTAWDDALKPGPSRCTVFMGEMARAAGVEPGRLVTS